MRFLIVVDYHCLRLDRISTLCNNCYGAGIFCRYLSAGLVLPVERLRLC